jgi:CheY-like chemotaxis protein
VANPNPRRLAGRRILVVEDEMLLALDLQTLLEEQGCEVLEPASSVRRALAVLETRLPDAASLDMNLNGESSAPVAAALRERGIPFVVVTGYSGKNREDPVFRDVPLVKKPYDSAAFIESLVRLLA